MTYTAINSNISYISHNWSHFYGDGTIDFAMKEPEIMGQNSKVTKPCIRRSWCVIWERERESTRGSLKKKCDILLGNSVIENDSHTKRFALYSKLVQVKPALSCTWIYPATTKKNFFLQLNTTSLYDLGDLICTLLYEGPRIWFASELSKNFSIT